MPAHFKHTLMTGALCLSLYATSVQHATACTRALYVGTENTVITGRTMDWAEDMHTNLWVFPRGISRQGEAGPDSMRWVSKYGSVVASVYELASADGMNEKGLVMNLLYLAESDYGAPAVNHPAMSITTWGQYTLDNFATVSEAVETMQHTPLYLIAPTLPNGVLGQAHLSLSDSTGDSAIFEYINGELVIHHGPTYQVMTNSPIYSKQLALNEYWESIGGNVFLPGTSRAADRFARTSFYLSAIPKAMAPQYIQTVPDQSYSNQAIASVLSVMRAVSVPLGMTTPNEPNIASTIWRTVSDQKNRVYYFDSSTQPNAFWVSLSQLKFDKGAPILKLSLEKGALFAGETSQQFKPAPAFHFLPGISRTPPALQPHEKSNPPPSQDAP